MQRTVFRFGGTNQQTGSRHIQQGQLVEARNVRQLKDGEYRKRRGFFRQDPIETLIIDNVVYRRGASFVGQNALSLGTISHALPGGAEEVLASGTGTSNTNIPWHWPALGVGTVKVGLSALMSISSAVNTIRVRIGGTASALSTVSGTLVHSESMSVGAGQTIEFISGEAACPTAVGTLQYNGFSAALSGIDASSFMPWFQPVGGGQVIGLPLVRNLTFSSETVLGQWYVDFDQFSAAVANITVGPAILLTAVQVGETATMTVKIGGTVGAADGTTAATFTKSAAGQTGTSATFAKPTGVNLVKLIGQMSSANATMAAQSILLVAQ